MLKNICVYCGASFGNNPSYRLAAKKLGQQLALSGRRLVYGGGSKGLMGVVADAVLDSGGEVIGVITERLVSAETAHNGLTELIIVPDMHARKAKMSAMADGFIALPGGIGTLEELFEIWTWSQIGYHNKPVALVNENGFYDPLLSFLRHSAQEGFVRDAYLDTLIISTDPAEILQRLDHYTPHNLERWAKS